MKLLITTLFITLVTLVPKEKSLKTILRDGQFSKLPKAAKIIGHEVVVDGQKRFGYLAFQASSGDIATWIKKSKLALTHKEEIFNTDIFVWPSKTPQWFKDSSEKFVGGDIYYSKREADGFVTVGWVDIDVTVVHIEYEIRN